MFLSKDKRSDFKIWQTDPINDGICNNVIFFINNTKLHNIKL